MWTDTVREKVQANEKVKRQSHAFLADKSSSNWLSYRKAKSEATKAVAATKASYFEDLHKQLDIRRAGVGANTESKDVTYFLGVNDEDGSLIMDRKTAAERWGRHFDIICNIEFPHPPVPPADLVSAKSR